MLFPHLADVLSLFLKAPQLKTAPTGRFAGLTEEKAVAETLKVGTATPRRNRRRPTDPGVADIIQLTRTTFGFFAQAAVAEARGRCRLARENWALLGKARWTEKLQFESNCAHRAHDSSEISPWRAGRLPLGRPALRLLLPASTLSETSRAPSPKNYSAPHAPPTVFVRAPRRFILFCSQQNS